VGHVLQEMNLLHVLSAMSRVPLIVKAAASAVSDDTAFAVHAMHILDEGPPPNAHVSGRIATPCIKLKNLFNSGLCRLLSKGFLQA
jgi:hypothetical protein